MELLSTLVMLVVLHGKIDFWLKSVKIVKIFTQTYIEVESSNRFKHNANEKLVWSKGREHWTSESCCWILAFNPDCLKRTVKFSKIVMILGCMSSNGIGKLRFITGTVLKQNDLNVETFSCARKLCAVCKQIGTITEQLLIKVQYTFNLL